MLISLHKPELAGHKLIAGVLLAFALALLGVSLFRLGSDEFMSLLVGAVILLCLALPLWVGRIPDSFDMQLPWILLKLRFSEGAAPVMTRRTLDPSLERTRRDYADQQRNIPGADAAPMRVLEQDLALQAIPCADPMTPMYMLDAQFRIVDWNDAFTLAFDRTMEGMRFQSVLEWVYYLDNYEEVLSHGIDTFREGADLPLIDVERICYTSAAYGSLQGTKRAYRVPDDAGDVLGWLVTIDPEFADTDRRSKYYSHLFARLQQCMVWSEYALSYDRVLMNTRVYPELIATLLGEENPKLARIGDDARVLDLGAGTGNITKRLADTGRGRLIVAIDNNRLMLNVLRNKCQPYLRQNATGAGVIAIRQDIGSLFGLDNNYFDVVVCNNVLYTLEESAVGDCLREIYRVLKPGGELRVAGPKKKASLNALFSRIRRDLKQNGMLEEVEAEYEHVLQINYKHLLPMLHRWNTAEVIDIVREAGFAEIIYTNEKAYAGQSRIVCARK